MQAGTTFAASDRFAVTITGQGGHAGMPHRTRDALLAASMAVVALQPLVSREVNPLQGGVVSVTRFNTGGGAQRHLGARWAGWACCTAQPILLSRQAVFSP